MQRRATHDAIYGSVVIRRGYCSLCNGYALILDGKLACCGVSPKSLESAGYEKMSDSVLHRWRPRGKVAASILAKQEGKCFYCNRRFGSIVFRKGHAVHLRVAWDHSVPHCFSRNNQLSNFVAACNICNGLKSGKVFDSIEEVTVYVCEAWERKGYTEALRKLQGTIQAKAGLAEVL